MCRLPPNSDPLAPLAQFYVDINTHGIDGPHRARRHSQHIACCTIRRNHLPFGILRPLTSAVSHFRRRPSTKPAVATAAFASSCLRSTPLLRPQPYLTHRYRAHRRSSVSELQWRELASSSNFFVYRFDDDTLPHSRRQIDHDAIYPHSIRAQTKHPPTSHRCKLAAAKPSMTACSRIHEARRATHEPDGRTPGRTNSGLSGKTTFDVW
ncbi:hypothetical protein FHX59_006525 [Paraburkholderia silvatlantica]|uniref:Uncharacterized protein n=1 Tax=Paraburkholderia silvatlantica TaxID=321895 RepID=A0ABR6FX95_9BURK|nr:hypothetical protein [Paraburkholderia silvatlantica]PVY24726.1 hypothetical protein C7411_127115 [Paraburkholderia silvatlantica]PXW31222.1 hypothetical protein C7413_126115 [Paraburkholderia silvatlantica]